MPTSPDLSPVARARNIQILAQREFDVLVLGAGINGAAVAAELARQGLSVAIIDKGDFGSGTSQASGNLVWGGIKYLAQGRLGLVRRLCAERNRFVERAPHCVRERRFLAPIFKGDPYGLAAVAWGARLHWALGGFQRSHAPEVLHTPAAVLAVAPHLRGDRLAGGVIYTDAQIMTSDAHLTFEIVRTAIAHGAIAVNYIEAIAFRKEGERLMGVDARDGLSGGTFPIAAKLVVNATGIWADRVSAQAGVADAPHRLALRRGTFLYFRPEDFDCPPVALDGPCIVMQAAADHRPFFIYSWGPVVIIGTTDIDHDPAALDDVRSTPDEIAFIVRELQARFRLKPGVDASRVVESRVGVRPLAVSRAADVRAIAGEEALALSRDHAIDVDVRRRLFTILGGKFTPAREVAADVAMMIGRRFPDVWAGRSWWDTAHEPLFSARGIAESGALEAFATAIRGEAAALGLPPDVAAHLVSQHGGGARTILDRIRADRALGEPVYPGLPYLWAEVRDHAEGSMVTCLDDLLRRRTNLAQWVPFGGFGAKGEHEAVVRQVAEEIGRANGWPGERASALVENHRRIVEKRNGWRRELQATVSIS